MDAGEGDYVFEAFQFADDEGAVCPWARVRDVEMVTTSFRREFAPLLDEIAELTIQRIKSVSCYRNSRPLEARASNLEIFHC